VKRKRKKGHKVHAPDVESGLLTLCGARSRRIAQENDKVTCGTCIHIRVCVLMPLGEYP